MESISQNLRLAASLAEAALEPFADALHPDAQGVWGNPEALGHLFAVADALALFALIVTEAERFL